MQKSKHFTSYAEAMKFAKKFWKQGKQAVMDGGYNDQTVYYYADKELK